MATSMAVAMAIDRIPSSFSVAWGPASMTMESHRKGDTEDGCEKDTLHEGDACSPVLDLLPHDCEPEDRDNEEQIRERLRILGEQHRAALALLQRGPCPPSSFPSASSPVRPPAGSNSSSSSRSSSSSSSSRGKRKTRELEEAAAADTGSPSTHASGVAAGCLSRALWPPAMKGVAAAGGKAFAGEDDKEDEDEDGSGLRQEHGHDCDQFSDDSDYNGEGGEERGKRKRMTTKRRSTPPSSQSSSPSSPGSYSSLSGPASPITVTSRLPSSANSAAGEDETSPRSPVAHPWTTRHRKSRNGRSGRKRRTPRVMTGRTCMHCRATSTPEWRTGPAGKGTLCNACGLRWKKTRTLL